MKLDRRHQRFRDEIVSEVRRLARAYLVCNPKTHREWAIEILQRSGMTEWESIYYTSAGCLCPPIDGGLEQYRRMESKGLRPSRPAWSFLKMMEGKAGFHMARTEMKEGWLQGDDRWPGLLYLRATTPDSILRKLIDWHPEMHKAREVVA